MKMAEKRPKGTRLRVGLPEIPQFSSGMRFLALEAIIATDG
jgi:hypothetical protein